MFSRLKRLFSDLVSAVTGKISESDIERFFKDREIEFIEADVSFEVLDYLKNELLRRVNEYRTKSPKDETIKQLLAEVISGIFPQSQTLPEIYAASGKKPFTVVFLGINGTGKTTTVAKVAFNLKNTGIRPLMVAADTFRTGAIEQLQEHGRKIGVEVYYRSYGFDPAALSRDAFEYARSNGYDVVLIDTAGRMQTNESLLNELMKLVSVVRSDLNIFVGDALAGYDMINQALAFLNKPGFSHSIVTKVDAEVKGGSLLNLAYFTKKPIMYVGTGQRYEDLEPFSSGWILRELLGG